MRSDAREAALRTIFCDYNVMKEHFPVIYSTISKQAILERLLPMYSIEQPTECTFLSRGCNDTYVVKTADGPSYILRVYRYGWRTLAEISFELDALLHLTRKGISVSTPIPGTDGQVVRVLPAPEGNRYAALFTYASGKKLSFEKSDAMHLGQALGNLHSAMDNFVSRHLRFELNWEHLITIPLQRLEPILAHRSQDWDFLHFFTDRLHKQLISLAPDDKGFCHGDVHQANINICQDNTLTFFDFDCCGAGWRAYDLATFRWSARREDRETEAWESLLRGYREARDLTAADLQAVPLFVAIRNIWLMGLHVGEVHWRGSGSMNDVYIDHHLTFLKDCERDYF